MNIKEIKSKAWKLIDGKKWELWKPYLIIMACNLFLTYIVTYVIGIDPESTSATIADSIISFILLPFTIGYITYLLNFIRGKKYEIKDVFSKMNNILYIWIINLIVSVAVMFGCVLLVVPGIIVGIMFSMTSYLLAEGETNIGDVLKKSAEMMKGYKWDYFMFCLSFLGWIVLGILTLGIAFIWVIPFMSVSMALYYEELKNKKSVIKTK